jgi:hypothetical protein
VDGFLLADDALVQLLLLLRLDALVRDFQYALPAKVDSFVI